MARIPIYEQQTHASGQLSVSANADSFGGGTAQALGSVAAGIADVGVQRDRILREQDEKDARAWSGSALSKATLDWTETLQKQKEDAPPGAPGFTPKVLAEFDTYSSKLIDSAPTKTAKEFVRQHMTAMRTSIGEQAIRFEGEARVGQRVDNAQSAIENAAKVVAQDPGQFAKMEVLLKETRPDVGPAMASKLDDQARKSLVQAAAASHIQTNPDNAYNTIYRSLHPLIDPPNKGSTSSQYEERGLRNNNPGNLRKSSAPWQGETVGSDPSFSSFATPEAGIRALGKNLLTYQDTHGLNTVQGIISRWAPATENDTGSYVNAVARAAGVSPDAPIDLRNPETLKAVTAAIIKHENGKQPYADGTLDAGLKAALGAADLPASNPDSVKAVSNPAVASMGIAADGEPTKTGVPWIDAMTVPERLHYLQQAATEQQRGLSTLQASLRSKEKDLGAMAMSGVAPPPSSIPSEQDYIRAYGQVDGPANYRANVLDIVQLGDGIRALQTASPIERNAIIKGAEPQPGSGYDHAQKMQAALIKANSIIEKQLTEDPAEYVLRTSPSVKSAFVALQNGGGDPIVTAAYVNAMNAEQQRLGVTAPKGPGETIQQPRLLTTSQANAVAAQFYDQTHGGAKAADTIAALENQWGPAWPQVYAQLARENKLPDAVLVIPNMSDAGAKARMAAASVIKDEEFKKILAPSDIKDIHETLLSQFGDARTTFAAQGVNGVSTLGKAMDQAEKLARYYRIQDKSTSDAAKQAFAETMGWKYDFVDSYRVPKVQQPREVARGAEAYLQGLDKTSLQIMGAQNMSAEDQARLTADAVATNARWITNGDESGLRLMIQGNDGALYQVRNSSGEPVNVQWKTLREAGVTSEKKREDAIITRESGVDTRGKTLQDAAEADRQRRLREMGMR